MFSGILGVVDSALSFGTAVVTRLNLKDKEAFINRVRELRIQYQAENAKVDGERIDANLEYYRDQLLIETAAMNEAITAGILAGPK